MISHILVAPPATEPVTLAAMKAHARISHDSDDVLLEGLLRAARQWCEHFTRRAFITQSWALSVSCPREKRAITLPRAPVLGVTYVHLYDEDDVATLWDESHYYVDSAGHPAHLVLRDGMSWPTLTRSAGGMVIEYTAGYGSDGARVPDGIKLAIMQLATHWYEHRGEAITGETITKTPMTIEALLMPYRTIGLGVL
ncbi:MAG TPA: hypothetical protein DCY07_01725 [Rhodospirillaceae bacterium]|nr:hypothetical protein [Rhodospirillaceae bacterium]